MEKQFNEKESLDLINQMIRTAKNNLTEGTGNIFLLWGYLVTIISLANSILLIILPPRIGYYSYFLWCLMAIGGPVHYHLIKKMQVKQLVTTYVDRIMGYVWTAFTVSLFLFIASMILRAILVMPAFVNTEPPHQFLRWFPWLFVAPFMLFMYGLGLFISGKAYNYKPLVTGGIICWLAGSFLVISMHLDIVLFLQQMTLALAAFFGFILPGHRLNKKEKANV